MFDFLNPFKAWIYIGVAILFAALSVYCYGLKVNNESLLNKVTQITKIAEDKQAALQTCSDNTLALKNKETKITEAAIKAITKAKLDAKDEYDHAKAVVIRKPKAPIVTKDNAIEYGGLDPKIQIEDYLSTQDLFNEEIDRRGLKK